MITEKVAMAGTPPPAVRALASLPPLALCCELVVQTPGFDLTLNFLELADDSALAVLLDEIVKRRPPSPPDIQ